MFAQMQEEFLKPVIVAGKLLWFSYVDLFYYVAAIRDRKSVV